VVPGTAGLEHRIGGLEKDALTGAVSYDPLNHETMIKTRAEHVERTAQECGPLDFFVDYEGDVLVVGWGGTFGALRQATARLRDQGKRVSHAHMRWLHPFNPRLEPVLRRFKHVLVAELNMGQLLLVLRAKFLIPAVGLNKVQGQPFKVAEVMEAVQKLLGEERGRRASSQSELSAVGERAVQ
jgi:2-oxoglutarate ferredoxin oxidoreductase subunit alpha